MTEAQRFCTLWPRALNARPPDLDNLQELHMNRLNLSLMTLMSLSALAACGSSTTPATTTTDDAVVDAAQDVAGTDATTTDAPKDAGKDTTKKDTGPVVDPDDKPETATAVTIGTTASPTSATADQLDPTGDVDYWKFEGKKGQLISIFLQAQGLQGGVAFDADTLDTVMTLYGPDKQQIAFNDDPSTRVNNDSEILTVLPADGTYYVRVEECWTWLAAHPQKGGISCGGTADKGNVDYSIFVGSFQKGDAGIVWETETGDTLKEATELPYVKDAKTAKYTAPTLVASFKGVVDTDVYHITTPGDVTATAGSRSTLFANLQKGGVDGNGSTAPMGLAWLASQATPTVMIAETDLAKADQLAPPIKPNTGYFIYVTRATGAATTNEFYLMDFYVGDGNPLEKAEAANDKAAGAEAVTLQNTTSGGKGGFVEGDLISSGADVDWWSLPVPSGFGSGTFYIVCGAQSNGSGLRGFKAEAFSAPTTAITGGSATEAADGLVLDKLPTPADGGTILVKFTATSQASDVTSTYYRCGIGFAAP